MHVCLRKRRSRFQFCPHQKNTFLMNNPQDCMKNIRFYNIGKDSLPISPISQSQGQYRLQGSLWSLSGVLYRTDSRRLIEVSNQDVIYLIFLETTCQIVLLISLIFPCDSATETCIKSERNGHRFYCGLPKFLNSMADNSSLDLSPDASPAESVNEKQHFDPCATTTDVPINSTGTSVCLEDPDPYHHNLSTLRLLFAHIGYVNFIYYVLISWSIQCCFNSIPCNYWCCEEYQIFPMFLSHPSSFIDNCLHESSNNCQRPARISSSIHMGRRCVYADPDRLPTPVWKGLWPSGTEGLLLLFLYMVTITNFYLQNVLYFSMAIFALGSALCGAAQVSLSSSRA